jgi:hypothetical protein
MIACQLTKTKPLPKRKENEGLSGDQEHILPKMFKGQFQKNIKKLVLLKIIKLKNKAWCCGVPIS